MSPVLNNQIWMRPVREEDLPALRRAAEADAHVVLAPTHVFEKAGQMVGYASVMAVPLIMPWFDSRQCGPRDSMQAMNLLENLVTLLWNGKCRAGMVPFAVGSPFLPQMERLGYTDCGTYHLGLKKMER